MRYFYSVIIFFYTTFLTVLSAGNVVAIDDSLKGVYRMYDFDTPRVNVPAPKGYDVFYLSHYGRHGSRYLHNEREYDSLNVVLHREELTQYGETIRDKFDEYYPLLKGRATDLSHIGMAQHRMLAQRMFVDYPELFRRGAVVNACSSDIPRCMMSMLNFLDQLRQCRADLDIRADFNSSQVPLFRAAQVERFPLKEYIAANFDHSRLFESLFACPDAAAAKTDAGLFAQTLFYYACHLEGVGINDDFFDSVFEDMEIQALHAIESEKFSYHRGRLCPVNTAVAGPSLKEIVLAADEDIRTGVPMVRLRFGHDNMIMNIMSLLALSPFDGARFDCSDVPMASNIRFVFAKDKRGDILVKVQYNESDVMGWTAWNLFREYCMDRICWNPGERSIFEANSSYNPKFIAHRGLQLLGPENSITSFKAAARNGMWAIETDFRMTADGNVVCIHDKTLDRTTNGSGPVAGMTLAEIRNLRLLPVNGKTVVPEYDYEAIPDSEKLVPTMEEYLKICAESGCIAFIELKEDKGIISLMKTAIEQTGMRGRCVISSGKLELLERYREQGGTELIHLIFATPDKLERMKELGNASVSFKYSSLDAELNLDNNGTVLTTFKELVDYVHSLGIKICFRAADDDRAALKHIDLGVDYMPTNVMYSIDQSSPLSAF